MVQMKNVSSCLKNQTRKTNILEGKGQHEYVDE